MALRRSISAPIIAAARSAVRSPPSVRPSLFTSPLRRPTPRSVGALGAAISLLPLHSVVAAARLNSHLPVDARACCGMSKGTCKDP